MLLHALVQSLTKEEKSQFKSYLFRKNKRPDAKNSILFTLLQASQIPHDLDVIIYGKSSRNAYHALCKRLYENLIDFIAVQHIEKSDTDTFNLLKLIVSGQSFYERKQFELGRKIIHRAERLAIQLEAFSSLHEIYHIQVEHLQAHPDMQLEPLIEKITQNQRLLAQQERLNLAYASIKQQLRDHSKQHLPETQDIVLNTFHRFQINIDETLNFRSLHTLLEILHTTAHLEHNFSEIIPYIQQIENQIRQKSITSTTYVSHKIQFNYLMASTYFRVKQFDQSKKYASQMEEALLAEKGRYLVRFRESALIINALLANYTGAATQAIDSLATYLQKNKSAPNPDLTLALVMFYVQQQGYCKAHAALNKLIHSDSWYLEKAGQDWLIKKHLIEMVIHIELKNTDLVESLFRRFKRNYKTLLKTEERLQKFIKFAWIIHNKPEEVGGKRFRESVKNHFTTQNQKQEDVFILSFFAWIKSKINQKPLYETTLELL